MEKLERCEKCNGRMKYYDSVWRTIIRKGGMKSKVLVERRKFEKCGHTVRILPHDIYPHKLYEADIIEGVLEGFIDSDTLGFEDYPSEDTMKRWRKEKKHL